MKEGMIRVPEAHWSFLFVCGIHGMWIRPYVPCPDTKHEQAALILSETLGQIVNWVDKKGQAHTACPEITH